MLGAVAAFWRWATDQCDGGRATTAIGVKFSVAFLIGIALFAWYIARPWAEHEYGAWKAERRENSAAIVELQRLAGIERAVSIAKDQEQDARLDRIEPRVEMLSDRVSRIEGRVR